MDENFDPQDDGGEMDDTISALPSNGASLDSVNGDNGYGGIVRAVSIDDEMRASYLDYAMSVIVARVARCTRRFCAVHRRILYAMNDGVAVEYSYKKSAYCR